MKLISLLFMVFTFSAFGKLTLEDLNFKLKQWGATWKAGKTRISELTIEEKRRLTGAILEEGFGDYFYSKKRYWESNEELPKYWDWRNVEGVSFASPILDQGYCGSCVAFAATYLLETQTNITRNTPNSPWHYSAQHLFSCGGGACDMGWTMGSAISFLKNDGVPDEACFPYKSGAKGDDFSCKETCSDYKDRVEKIVSYKQPTFFWLDVEEIKKAVLKGPVMTDFEVYEDFTFYVSGVYKHVVGEFLGGHAVTIIGWNDDEKAWIVSNSWGSDWGENGFFRIAWDNSTGFGNSTFSIETAKPEGYIAIEDLVDYAAINGVVSISINSTFPDLEKIEWSLIENKTNNLLSGATLRGNDIITLDTTKFNDGVYTFSATAYHNGTITKAQPKIVYILNGDFYGEAKFTNLSSGQKVTGRVLLDFDLNFKPVPFNKIIFWAKNITTGDLIKRESTNIATKVTLSWRTSTIPKGDYEVFLECFVGALAKVSSEKLKITVE